VWHHADTQNLEKCRFYLSPITLQFLDFIHWIVLDLLFGYVTVKTILHGQVGLCCPADWLAARRNGWVKWVRQSNDQTWSLYIELTISFLIGRKHTVKFRKRRLWRHLTADYTKIMSRVLKVTNNHVIYDPGARCLRLIMSSSHTVTYCHWKKQKHDFQFFFSFNVQ